MNKISGIYSVTNTINHKRYIGQSRDINRRWFDLKKLLRHNKHYNLEFQKEWNEYGESNYIFEILRLVTTQDERDYYEQYYIAYYHTTDSDSGYNIAGGGMGKMQIILDCTRKKISDHHHDVSGVNNPFYGKAHSEEVKQKILQNSNYQNRKIRGEDSWRCGITEDIAREIKEYFSVSENNKYGAVKKLAEKYGISVQTVSHIKNGHTWNWL